MFDTKNNSCLLVACELDRLTFPCCAPGVSTILLRPPAGNDGLGNCIALPFFLLQSYEVEDDYSRSYVGSYKDIVALDEDGDPFGAVEMKPKILLMGLRRYVGSVDGLDTVCRIFSS